MLYIWHYPATLSLRGDSHFNAPNTTTALSLNRLGTSQCPWTKATLQLLGDRSSLVPYRGSCLIALPQPVTPGTPGTPDQWHVGYLTTDDQLIVGEQLGLQIGAAQASTVVVASVHGRQSESLMMMLQALSRHAIPCPREDASCLPTCIL